jgi:hypothetical protein
VSCGSPEKQDNEEPQRARAQDGDIVGVDVDGVPADVLGGKGDRIRRDEEITIA